MLIPVWVLGRSIAGEKQAITACLLYLCIPSVNLITLHLDQVLFPFLAIFPVVLIVRSCILRSTALAILSGITLYIAVYFSFGLFFVAPIIMMVFVVTLLRNPSKNWFSTVRLLGFTIVGIAISDIMMRLLLNYLDSCDFIISLCL